MPEKDGASTSGLCTLRVVSSAPPPPLVLDAVGDPSAPIHTVQCLFTNTLALTLTVRGHTAEEVSATAVREAGQMSSWKALDEHGPIWIDRIALGSHDSAYADGAPAVPIPSRFGEAGTLAAAVALDMATGMVAAQELLELLQRGQELDQDALAQAVAMIDETLATYGIARDDGAAVIAKPRQDATSTFLPTPFGPPPSLMRLDAPANTDRMAILQQPGA